MKPHEIERRVLNIIEQVQAHRKVEDSRVELKSTWLPAEKAARQIAGHANAAGGETILWVIGVDEEKGVCGTDNTEVSEWVNRVKSQFDELPIDLHYNLTVPYDNKVVVALVFDTDRAPYVVKNPNGVNPHREVPWREGNETRTAKRRDLLKILSPLQLEPRIEVVKAELIVPEIVGDDRGQFFKNGLFMDLFIEPSGSKPVTFPVHRSEAYLKESDSLALHRFDGIFFRDSGIGVQLDGPPSSQSVVLSRTEVTIFTPGMFAVHANLEREIAVRIASEQLEIKVLFGMTGLDLKIPINLSMTSSGIVGDPSRIWRLE